MGIDRFIFRHISQMQIIVAIGTHWRGQSFQPNLQILQQENEKKNYQDQLGSNKIEQDRRGLNGFELG